MNNFYIRLDDVSKHIRSMSLIQARRIDLSRQEIPPTTPSTSTHHFLRLATIREAEVVLGVYLVLPPPLPSFFYLVPGWHDPKSSFRLRQLVARLNAQSLRYSILMDNPFFTQQFILRSCCAVFGECNEQASCHHKTHLLPYKHTTTMTDLIVDFPYQRSRSRRRRSRCHTCDQQNRRAVKFADTSQLYIFKRHEEDNVPRHKLWYTQSEYYAMRRAAIRDTLEVVLARNSAGGLPFNYSVSNDDDASSDEQSRVCCIGIE